MGSVDSQNPLTTVNFIKLAILIANEVRVYMFTSPNAIQETEMHILTIGMEARSRLVRIREVS